MVPVPQNENSSVVGHGWAFARPNPSSKRASKACVVAAIAGEATTSDTSKRHTTSANLRIAFLPFTCSTGLRQAPAGLVEPAQRTRWGNWTCGITSSREVRADGWHRSGIEAQADGPMRRKPVTADRSVADPAARAPRAPPMAAIAQPVPFIPRTQRLSMLHSSGYSLIRAQDRGLAPCEVSRTRPGRPVSSYLCRATPDPNHVVLAGRALYVLQAAVPSGRQRSTAVSRRGPDPRQRRIAVNLTVLPSSRYPSRCAALGSQGTLRSRPWTAIGCESGWRSSAPSARSAPIRIRTGTVATPRSDAHAPPGANGESRAQGARPGPRQLQPRHDGRGA